MPLIIEDEIKTTGTAATDLTITCGTEKTLVETLGYHYQADTLGSRSISAK